MKKLMVIAISVVGLLATPLVTAAPAAARSGSSAATARVCVGGAVSTAGPFLNPGACVRYALNGGAVYPVHPTLSMTITRVSVPTSGGFSFYFVIFEIQSSGWVPGSTVSAGLTVGGGQGYQPEFTADVNGAIAGQVISQSVLDPAAVWPQSYTLTLTNAVGQSITRTGTT